MIALFLLLPASLIAIVLVGAFGGAAAALEEITKEKDI